MFVERFLNKKAVVIVITLLVLVSILSYLTVMVSTRRIIPPITTFPTPSPFPVGDRRREEQPRVSSLQKTRIGQPTGNLEIIAGFEKKETLPDGSTKYSFTGIVSIRPNEVVAKNGIAVFERVVTPEKSTEKGYARISEYTQKHGQPERVIKGSLFYGDFGSTYIYASNGLSFIGNPFTNEIFEFHIYPPTIPDEYVRQYGQDINPRQEPVNEGP